MDVRFWSVICCVLMVVAIIGELLTPSMGPLTITALCFAGGSIYLAFSSSAPFGYVMLAANVALLPLTVWLCWRLLRNSPLIHRAEVTAENQNAPDAPPLTRLLGQSGRSLTPLRPAGSVLIGSERVDVVTEGKFIENNVAVKVIRVEGSHIFVEQT